jgi:hypothetical protein
MILSITPLFTIISSPSEKEKLFYYKLERAVTRDSFVKRDRTADAEAASNPLVRVSVPALFTVKGKGAERRRERSKRSRKSRGR